MADRLDKAECAISTLWRAVCRLQSLCPGPNVKAKKRRWSTSPTSVLADPTWGQTVGAARSLHPGVSAVPYGPSPSAGSVVAPRVRSAAVTGVTALGAHSDAGIVSLTTPTARSAGVTGVTQLFPYTPGVIVDSARVMTAGVSASAVPQQLYGPIGSYLVKATNTALSGYLLCEGGTFSATTYPLLASEIGDTFGAHSGDNYLLPDMRDRAWVFKGSGRAVGDTGGAATVTLTTAQLPALSYTVTDPGHTHVEQTNNAPTGGSGYVFPVTATTGSAPASTSVNTQSATTGISVSDSNGGGSHNNMPPWICPGYVFIRSN